MATFTAGFATMGHIGALRLADATDGSAVTGPGIMTPITYRFTSHKGHHT